MSGYTLRLRAGVSGVLDGSPLRPDTLGRLPHAQVEQTPLLLGNRTVPLAEVFEVSGEPGTALSAEFPPPAGAPRLAVLQLAAAMTAGTLTVRGGAGDLCGTRMTGGCINVVGRAGALLGAGMSGGLIRVDGPVGECTGGPPPDATRGMTGGEIVVTGELGPRAGFRMRRGMIAAAGAAGPHPGHAMIAGTVVVCDGPLVQPGLEMKRGTILALSPTARHEIGPAFARDCRGNPVIVRLIIRRLAELGLLDCDAAAAATAALYDSYSGDRLSLGKGELFVRTG